MEDSKPGVVEGHQDLGGDQGPRVTPNASGKSRPRKNTSMLTARGAEKVKWCIHVYYYSHVEKSCVFLFLRRRRPGDPIQRVVMVARPDAPHSLIKYIEESCVFCCFGPGDQETPYKQLSWSPDPLLCTPAGGVVPGGRPWTAGATVSR